MNNEKPLRIFCYFLVPNNWCNFTKFYEVASSAQEVMESERYKQKLSYNWAEISEPVEVKSEDILSNILDEDLAKEFNFSYTIERKK